MSTPRSAASDPPERATAAHEIAEWLTRAPRQLPSHFLYDQLGSSLFEAICHLPWYRVAATEQRLLTMHAADIGALIGTVSEVVELGPGSGAKLMTLLSAWTMPEVTVHLVDVSTEALEQASRTLASRDGIRVSQVQATYEQGLATIDLSGSRGQAFVAFLGSNIGNFDRTAADALLRAIRSALPDGGSLLLGADLVKSEAELLLAYDDPLGVTAAFNRNLLLRINRELGGDFDIGAFSHRAVWNAVQSRMEMHLVSRSRQRVRIAAADLDLTFQSGDAIWTESSYKYRVDDLAPMLTTAGFQMAGQWVEDGFALTLARAV
jgi:L-histidine Nalpha-methyltransferase